MVFLNDLSLKQIISLLVTHHIESDGDIFNPFLAGIGALPVDDDILPAHVPAFVERHLEAHRASRLAAELSHVAPGAIRLALLRGVAGTRFMYILLSQV